MRTNKVGDTLVPIEISMRFDPVRSEDGSVAMNLSKVLAFSVGFDSRSGERYYPINNCDELDVQGALANGVVTLEWWAQTETGIKALYDYIGVTV